eukprot:13511859-Ditylum_brightwellii.AAC.1
MFRALKQYDFLDRIIMKKSSYTKKLTSSPSCIGINIGVDNFRCRLSGRPLGIFPLDESSLFSVEVDEEVGHTSLIPLPSDSLL